MARTSSFTGGKSFATRSHITIGSLDFLFTATGEPRLIHSDSIFGDSMKSGVLGVAEST
jgi:hypothetical protein